MNSPDIKNHATLTTQRNPMRIDLAAFVKTLPNGLLLRDIVGRVRTECMLTENDRGTLENTHSVSEIMDQLTEAGFSDDKKIRVDVSNFPAQWCPVWERDALAKDRMGDQ